MARSTDHTDRIFLRPSYTVHYRKVRAFRWSGEARPVYTAVFLLKGALSYEAKSRTGKLKGRGALLIEPGEAATARGEQAEVMILTLDPTLVLDGAIRARLARAEAHISFRPHTIERDERLERLARDLADELVYEEAGQEAVVGALIEQVVIHLLRRYANLRRADELELSRAGLIDRRIRRAVELMQAHLDRDLSLEAIAAAAHLSPFHFARLFKKATGLSPHAYLAALRIARAQTLLAETDLSITEVSARVGYESPSHFAKAFRQSAGLPPRAFRAALIPR
jgi:AraC family transcriptional regulator